MLSEVVDWRVGPVVLNSAPLHVVILITLSFRHAVCVLWLLGHPHPLHRGAHPCTVDVLPGLTGVP